jgi:hypothetical protein
MNGHEDALQDVAGELPGEDTPLGIGQIEDLSLSTQESPEASLRQAAEASAAAGKPLQVKVALHLYDPGKQTYIGWRRQAWRLALADAEAARGFRDTLAVFFAALAMLGPNRLRAVLQQAMAEARG